MIKILMDTGIIVALITLLGVFVTSIVGPMFMSWWDGKEDETDGEETD